MNFVVALPTTMGGYDSIWMVIDRLTKFTFYFSWGEYMMKKLAQLYTSHIVRLHGMPIFIVSDRGSFVHLSLFKGFIAWFGTQLDMSIVFHPQQMTSMSGRFKR